jgi:hypothetical protein
MSNDFTYTVRASGAVIVATTDLDTARREAMVAAKAMTAKGGATGHVLIDYWTRGAVTDTEHVYDDRSTEATPTTTPYAAELDRRRARLSDGMAALSSVTFHHADQARQRAALVVLGEARDIVVAQIEQEVGR